jgi:cation diffusion facilitator family transporter
MAAEQGDRVFLMRFARLSIAAAVLTIGLKTVAWLLTGSIGLLSDALESLVNLAGGIMALCMLSVAARPADEDHAYGHSKAEYFSSGFEGMLVLIAAFSIGFAAVQRLLSPRDLERIGLGLGVSVLASLVNLGVALVIRKAGRRHRSITLEANAKHLLTDVWTSAGVLVGVGLVAATGWRQLDPIVAILVACNIVWTGMAIVRQSVSGLMDRALPADDLEIVTRVLEKHRVAGVEYHEVRTRQAGSHRFVSLHILVPGAWTVHAGHGLLEHIEGELRDSLPELTVFTHLESLEDSASWNHPLPGGASGTAGRRTPDKG